MRSPCLDAAITELRAPGSATLHALVWDVETRGVLDLQKVGAPRYAAHPNTEVLCLACAIDDEPVGLWLPGDPVPLEFTEAANDPSWVTVAHSAEFEAAILEHILAPRFGFPLVPLERQRCTMAAASALALPASLDTLAQVLSLENQKDAAGARVMLQLAKPRRAHKNEAPGVYWFEDSERLERLYAYCAQDVVTERELYQLLAPLPPAEQAIWELDQAINGRGFFVDRAFVEAARRIAEATRPEIDAELAQITDGAVHHATEVARVQAWLAGQGHTVGSLNKKSIATLLETELPPQVRRVLELRRAGGQAAARKLVSLLAVLDDDDRARGQFRYHAASTGRWVGRGFQPQNLKRPEVEDLDAAVKAVATGDYAHVRASYPDPLAVVGECLRPTICAPPGHRLIGADFSGIESRVTAWIADEESKLEVFREFDSGGGPDPYIVAASKIFRKNAAAISKAERQVGKCAELAFGFAGGVGAFRRLAPPEVNAQFTDEQVDRLKFAWRAAHPRIETFWHALNRAAIAALRHPCQLMRCGRVAFEGDDAPFLWLTLPSGRRLAYPHARLVQDEGRLTIAYKDNGAGQWRDERMYGGKFCENCVQAIARDLLAEANAQDRGGGVPDRAPRSR